MPVRIKGTDEPRTSTTVFADDSDLVVSLAASEEYFFETIFNFEAGATPDIKCNFLYTGTVVDATWSCFWAQSGDDRTQTGAAPQRTIFCNESNIGGFSLTVPGNDTAETAGVVCLRGVIRTNSSGDLKWQWAQNTSSLTASTALAGSYIRYTPVLEMPGTFIVKNSNESRSSTTTLAPDSDLVFDCEIGGQFIGELFVMGANAAAADWKERISLESTDDSSGHMSSLNSATAGSHPSTATGFLCNSTNETFLQGVENSFAASNNTFRYIHYIFSALLDADTSALTHQYAYEWAQLVNSGTAIRVDSPSYLWIEQIE